MIKQLVQQILKQFQKKKLPFNLQEYCKNHPGAVQCRLYDV